MPTFIMTGTWTDQGIRGVKEAPKRAQAARDLAKKLDVEIKQAFLTCGCRLCGGTKSLESSRAPI